MYDHLIHGVTTAGRVAAITDEIRSHGYEIKQGSWRYSMTNPITRKVILRDGAMAGGIDDPTLFALLAHEGCHVRQQAGPLWRRLWWGFRYSALGILGAVMVPVGLALMIALAEPWFFVMSMVGVAFVEWSNDFRLSVEIEAEGEELVAKWVSMDPDASPVHLLGGMRLPYLTYGSVSVIDAMIRVEALGLLRKHVATPMGQD